MKPARVGLGLLPFSGGSRGEVTDSLGIAPVLIAELGPGLKATVPPPHSDHLTASWST